jgi:integrase
VGCRPPTAATGRYSAEWTAGAASRRGICTRTRCAASCSAAAGIEGTALEPVTAHGLRAGFVTQAYKVGLRDEEIMGHTRHCDLKTMRRYVRRARLLQDSPAKQLGL